VEEDPYSTLLVDCCAGKVFQVRILLFLSSAILPAKIVCATLSYLVEMLGPLQKLLEPFVFIARSASLPPMRIPAKVVHVPPSLGQVANEENDVRYTARSGENSI